MKKLMKHWIDENFESLLIISVILLLIAIGVYLVLGEKQDNQMCRDAGYIGQAVIGNQVVCYGYVESNRLVVVPIADLKDGQ